ncbi:MAG: type II secretion system protein [Planctomycetes bacterium]|nr:type II secretion system protein [Planctomycetota bacterium]
MNANEKRKGFTIVELLTVMGVIAILISLLVPALTLVRDYSKEIQQRAQFHAIDVGLEMYKTEFGSYPPSNDNNDLYDASRNDINDDTPYGGANKLAEAMVGLDMLGVHPNTDYRSDGMNFHDDGFGVMSVEYDVYHPNTDYFTDEFAETAEENVQARKGPFIDLENANVYTMRDVYHQDTGSFLAGGGSGNIEDSLVLCDEYVVKRKSGKKTGMPILYYRARRIYTQQDSEDTLEIADDIYYYPDNQNLLELGMPEDGTDHIISDTTNDYLEFENMIRNTQVTQVIRPYRADSYILISAGKDGMYGTPDDMFNFDKNE